MADLIDIRETVREKYAAAAKAAMEPADAAPRTPEEESGCCGSRPSSCAPTCGPSCGPGVFGGALYDEAAGDDVPAAAINASLGCGVPTAVADLHQGETVLDLGSGAGADVLISARRVGATGRAIGLDMTDEMLELARAHAIEAGVDNVEFRKGYLEDMPVADASVDVIISNCVINLSGDKPQVIREAARVLRPGGRFAVSDVIADPDMDGATRADMAAWTGCVAGALTEDEFRGALTAAGFVDIEIRETHRVHEHAGAAIIRARKPESPMSPGNCSLAATELDAQLQRYGELAQHAARVEHRPDSLVVRFDHDPPAALLERTLQVERGCCPFFTIAYVAEQRRLEISIEDPERRPALDALATALAPDVTGNARTRGDT